MVLPMADLHTHTVFSDGYATVEDIAAMIADQESITEESILEQMDLKQAVEFGQRHSKMLSDRFTGLAEKSVEVVKSLNTISRPDHNTLLGTEELIAEMEKHAPKKRLVVGIEFTALAELPHVGQYPVHVLAYFYDKDGFNMLERKKQDRDRFFRTILQDYMKLINQVAEANSYRFLHGLRQRCNEHFFDGKERITEDDVLNKAKSRLEPFMSPESIMNTDNHALPVFHTDIAAVLSQSGIKGTPAEIADKYFRREGELYVPLSENPFTVHLEELLAELGSISSQSEVKVMRGTAHLSTYTRVIARNMFKNADAEPDDFYGKWAENAAAKTMYGIVNGLIGKQLIEFIESDYPRYTRKPPSIEDKEAFEDYIAYIKKEAEFTQRQIQLWRETAFSMSLKTSGGSDTHFRKGTPVLGCGFGELNFEDIRVDELFGKH